MSYAHRRYLLMTLDPTHIGAGGYRIGRVDNSIVRESGTNLPKIPGTSLSGAIRSYAAYRYGKIRCAGQGQPKRDDPDSGHCGKNDCPICYTFGFTKGEGESAHSYSGTVNIYDAHILLFPISSMIGPLWISTKKRLEEFSFAVGGATPDESPGSESCAMTQARTEPINLGWVMLPVSGLVTVSPPAESNWTPQTEWSSIQNRITLVPESLFSELVNSGLEVRTSVSINPATGAAESGQLFTYEAVPRATFLTFDLVQDNYRTGVAPWPVFRTAVRSVQDGNREPTIVWTENASSGRPLYPDPSNADKPATVNGQSRGWTQPCDVIDSGLEWASALGIGGMSTRGFGRFGLVGSGWSVPINMEVQHA